MPEFLELLAPTEALSKLLSNLPPRQPVVEVIPAHQALGRVTAQPVISPERLPAFSRSTVDGYAVRAADTHGANDALPAYLTLVEEVPMGRVPEFQIKPVQAALIHTGGMLPEGADAVVMLEHTQMARPAELEVLRAIAAGENTLQAGEDVETGDEVVATGVRLRPAEIGGLHALGLLEVRVSKQPLIGIISSGDEVAPPEAQLLPGQVRDINSYSLSAFIQDCGGRPFRYGIAPDTRQALLEALERALNECDAAVITAGSSASTRDLTAEVIQEMGPPGVLVHGVNVRPGKPTILAVCGGKAVIGLPGNPLSALLIARLFVRPVVERLLGLQAAPFQARVAARLTINLPSQAGREDWVPVRLIPCPGGFDAEPVFYKSNLIFTLARSDGLVQIPSSATGLHAGELVEVFPL